MAIFTREHILEVLKNVKIPGKKENMTEAHLISSLEVKEKSVFLEVQLPELNGMIEKSLRYQIEREIRGLEADVQVELKIQKLEKQPTTFSFPVIAVGSGKGGVGKSSMVVNLAVAFQELGYQVGILDCDIYGPSVPTMLSVSDQKPLLMGQKIQPVEAFGLKLMSAGFLLEPGQGVVWRGPMLHKIIQQFIHDVEWGALDILLVDLPPGTGDAPMSLSQTIPLTGAVMVSTPQHLSLIDVHRGISMFQKLHVPLLGVIENMSQFVCPACGHQENIFDHGGVEKFCHQIQVPYLGHVPLDSRLREWSDKGSPFLLQVKDSSAAVSIRTIAQKLQSFVKMKEEGKLKEQSLSYGA